MDAAAALGVPFEHGETGKRMPRSISAGDAGHIQYDVRWFLDENTEIEAAPAQRASVGA
jgi:hypothetical protein